MKRLLFGLLAVTAMAMTSCSKDAKINKRLDGEWKVTSYDGEAPESGETEIYSFKKTEKLSGTGTYSYASTSGGSSVSISFPFTYVIGDEKITVTVDYGSGSDSEIFEVVTYEKDKMEFKESDGTITVLEPK
ncbi:MAG: hypothetical protein K0R65_1421 [Crocinitomicaceae bacterium]|jgi:hypothetical protein|nr:hypothetical protein [Crocinitomicaceae bacterium]